jgi:ribosomal protein S18 acetylase RimI-like enzyme
METEGNAMGPELIRRIEQRAASAWPAAETEPLDGWLMRSTSGVTRRANSVLANTDLGNVPLGRKLARVEAFYEERGQPARYQLCPASLPGDLDAVLAERGYRTDAPTCVQTTSLHRLREASRPQQEGRMRIEPGYREDWYALYCAAEEVDGHAASVRREILRRIHAPCAYALLEVAGEPIAIGLGVTQGEWLGLFSVVTRPEFRRRGAAMAVLHALASWGEAQGAGSAYLQVMEENTGARALYERLGFETRYLYWYREGPTLPAGPR